MAKVKFEREMLDMFVAERNKLDSQIEQYEGKREELYNTVVGLENAIKDTEKANMDMKSGTVGMNAITYVENETKLVGLREQLEVAKKEFNTYDRLGDRVKEDVYTPLFEHRGAVQYEFKENAVEVQKEIFKALQRVEELCNSLYDLSAEYSEEFRYIPHPQSQYCTFNATPYITTVLSRFGIMNRGKIEYSKAVTSTLYDFEK